MVYHLNETELSQMMTWLSEVTEYYSETDTARLESVFNRALSTGQLEECDIYELLEVLPRIKPMTYAEIRSEEQLSITDWESYMSEQQARFKRDTENMCRAFSKWTFMVHAVYRRNVNSKYKNVTSIKVKQNQHMID